MDDSGVIGGPSSVSDLTPLSGMGGSSGMSIPSGAGRSVTPAACPAENATISSEDLGGLSIASSDGMVIPAAAGDGVATPVGFWSGQPEGVNTLTGLSADVDEILAMMAAPPPTVAVSAGAAPTAPAADLLTGNPFADPLPLVGATIPATTLAGYTGAGVDPSIATPVGYTDGGSANAVVPDSSAVVPASSAVVPAQLPVASGLPASLAPAGAAPVPDLSAILQSSASAVADANARAAASAEQAQMFQGLAEHAVVQAQAAERQHAQGLATVAEAARAAESSLAPRESELMLAAAGASQALEARERQLAVAADRASHELVTRERELQYQQAAVNQALLEQEQRLIASSSQEVEAMRQRCAAQAAEAMEETKAEAERRHLAAVQQIEERFSGQIRDLSARSDDLTGKLRDMGSELNDARRRLAHVEADNNAVAAQLRATTAERNTERTAREKLEEAIAKIKLLVVQRQNDYKAEITKLSEQLTLQRQLTTELEAKLREAVTQHPNSSAAAWEKVRERDDTIAALRTELKLQTEQISALEGQVRTLKALRAAQPPHEYRIASNSPGAESRLSAPVPEYRALGGLPASPPAGEALPRASGWTPLASGGAPSMASVPEGRPQRSGVATPLSSAPWAAFQVPATSVPSRERSRERASGEHSAPQLKLSLGEKCLGNIKVPQFSSQLAAFKENVRASVAACAISSDLAWSWAKVVERPGLTLNDFAESTALMGLSGDHAELSRLDYKMKQELTQKIPEGRLAHYIKRRELAYQDEKEKPLKGRQVLWLIYEFFSVGDTHEKIHRIHDLMKVEWRGDDKIAEFLDDWTDVYTQMARKPDHDTVREILMTQVRKSTRELKHALEEWDKLEPEEQTVAWMMEVLNRKVDTRRRLENKAEVSASVAAGRKGNTQPAAPTPKVAAAPPAQPACPLYLKGSCKNGASCPAPHPPNMQGKAKQNGNQQQQKQQPQQNPQQPSGNTQAGWGNPCWRFHEGKCLKGDACSFEHRQMTKKEKQTYEEAKKANPPRNSSPGVGSTVCVEYSKSKTCKNGEACPFSHPGYTRKKKGNN